MRGASTCMWRAARLQANGTALEAGDALRITDGSTLALSGAHDAEVLVFDLPGEAAWRDQYQ